MNKIANENNLKIALPLHPRTAKLLVQNLPPQLYNSVMTNPLIKILPPASFLEMIALEKNCMLVMTDSGGVQKEAFFFKKPCIILRSETEWVELVDCGAAVITDADEEKIIHSFSAISSAKNFNYPSIFGDGKASEFICREMVKYFGS